MDGDDDDVDAVELECLSMLTWHGRGSHLQFLLCSEHTKLRFPGLPWLVALNYSELQRPAFHPLEPVDWWVLRYLPNMGPTGVRKDEEIGRRSGGDHDDDARMEIRSIMELAFFCFFFWMPK